MQNDRQITISCGNSRKAVDWRQETLLISELWDKLRVPARGKETVAQYLGLKKPQQDELKDVGGFVGGSLNGPRRKARNVTGRDIITLDFDSIPPGGKDDVLRRIGALGCGYCVYSTRKHQPAAPRLRVLLPLDRTVTADEYEPIARKAAEWIGLEFADPTTFDVSRLMYWPSCCADSEYIYFAFDGPLVSASGVLGQYADWRDQEQWPQVPGTQNTYKKLAAKQGDPENKNGVVGAFCRTYDIYRAMDELLPGIYEPCDTMPGRYTYTGGSTTGGAVIYDDGKFLFSHHATDPCSGKLVNAFDLVRLHKFADADDEADPATPTNRLPSYTAMCRFATTLDAVAALMNTERYESAIKDFEGVGPDNSGEAANWMAKLQRNSTTGEPIKTPTNVLLALQNDPLLRGRIRLDTFSDRPQGVCPLPWGKREEACEGTVFEWKDADDNGLAIYILRIFGFWAPNIVAAGLQEHMAKAAFNPVQEYLNSLKGKWDGVPRLDTLFVDYLGAADTIYTRAVTRKGFVAAVARAMLPGCKYDNMVILSGPQGIGKSTLLNKMAGTWFNDSIRTFEGKEASELLQGTWIVEVAELDAFRHAEVARIKQFLSVKEDNYRKAYGRNANRHPRSCVFFGTTNTAEYLQDTTGNRRFWPIDTGEQPRTKSVFKDLDAERDQLWAEAYTRWQLGEPLYLTDEVEAYAKAKQEEHLDVSPLEGIIQAWLEREVPLDWGKWEIDKRRLYWANGVQGDVPTIPRTCVCIAEVWTEALGKPKEDLIKDKRQSHELGGILRHLGWEAIGTRKMAHYGSQKCYEKRQPKQ